MQQINHIWEYKNPWTHSLRTQCLNYSYLYMDLASYSFRHSTIHLSEWVCSAFNLQSNE